MQLQIHQEEKGSGESLVGVLVVILVTLSPEYRGEFITTGGSISLNKDAAGTKISPTA